MQGTGFRCFILIVIVAVGNLLLATVSGSRVEREARWPIDPMVYAVDSWSARPLTVQYVNGAPYISRFYERPDQSIATLILVTNTQAKGIYRAGGDVPFLGNGYAVEPAPPSLVPRGPGREALIVRSGNEVGLVLYTYGERRGLLGNGLLGWGMVAFDASLGRPNDYFKAYILAPLRDSGPEEARAVASLADTLFPRLASWYGS